MRLQPHLPSAPKASTGQDPPPRNLPHQPDSRFVSSASAPYRQSSLRSRPKRQRGDLSRGITLVDAHHPTIQEVQSMREEAIEAILESKRGKGLPSPPSPGSSASPRHGPPPPSSASILRTPRFVLLTTRGRSRLAPSVLAAEPNGKSPGGRRIVTPEARAPGEGGMVGWRQKPLQTGVRRCNSSRSS